MRPHVVASCCLILLASLVGSAELPGRTPADEIEMTGEPDGQRVAVVLPGASVHPIETRGDWTRVSLEGWIRTADATAMGIAPAAAAAPVTGTTAAPAPPSGAVPAEASIAGSIFVTGARGETAVGRGVAVRLLADYEPALRETGAIREQCAASRRQLQTQADTLKEQGSRAMKTIENPSRAFEAYDEAKRQRMATLKQLGDLDDDCARRIAGALDAATVTRSLSDGDGHYAIDRVAAGRYMIQAEYDAAGVRHTWNVEVTLAAAQRLTLDLTNANRTLAEPLPVYH